MLPLLLLAAHAAAPLPTSLPPSIAPGPEGSIDVFVHDAWWRRTLADGSFRASGPVPKEGNRHLAAEGGKWELRADGDVLWVPTEGKAVSRFRVGRELSQAMVRGQDLWTLEPGSIVHLTPDGARTRVAAPGVIAITPLADGYAAMDARRFRTFPSKGQPVCEAMLPNPATTTLMASDPTGTWVATTGDDGLLLWDASRCEPVSAAPGAPIVIGFVAEGLAMIERGGETTILSVPALDPIRRLPGGTDAFVVLAGQHGPVFYDNGLLLDPARGRSVRVADGAKVLRGGGYGPDQLVALDAGELLVVDSSGDVRRRVDAGRLTGVSLASARGEVMGVSDGYQVLRLGARDDVERWELPHAATHLWVDDAGAIEVESADGVTVLVPGRAAVPPLSAGRSRLARVRLVPGGEGDRVALRVTPSGVIAWDAVTGTDRGATVRAWPATARVAPSGRWAAGFVGETLTAWELSTGRAVWAVPGVRAGELILGEREIIVVRDGEVDVHDPRTGVRKWTVARPEAHALWSAFEVRAGPQGEVRWRSDGWGGTGEPLAWEGQPLDAPSPAVGDPVTDVLALAASLGWMDSAQDRPLALSQRRLPQACADREATDATYRSLPLLGAELQRWMAVRCVATALEDLAHQAAAGWADRAKTAIAEAMPALLVPAGSVRGVLGRSLDGAEVSIPTGAATVVFGGAVLPAALHSLPDGVMVIWVLAGEGGPGVATARAHVGGAGRVEVVRVSKEVMGRLALPQSGLMLVSPRGDALVRGGLDDVLRALPAAGLEAVDARLPTAARPTAWTYSAPSAVVRVDELPDGALLLVTATSFAVLGPDGAVRWSRTLSPDGDVRASSANVLLGDPSGVSALAFTDGHVVWRRVDLLRVADARSPQVAVGRGTVISAATGQELWRAHRILATDRMSAGALWSKVDGWWCGWDLATHRARGCAAKAPVATTEDRWLGTLSLSLDAATVLVATRQNGKAAWTRAGIVEVRPVSDTLAVAQLGNRAGTWALLDTRGRLSASLAAGRAIGPAAGRFYVVAGDRVMAWDL